MQAICVKQKKNITVIASHLYKEQYFKFGWRHSNQTWIVNFYKGFPHFTNITCPWGEGRVHTQNVGLGDFARFWLYCRRGATLIKKHILLKHCFGKIDTENFTVTILWIYFMSLQSYRHENQFVISMFLWLQMQKRHQERLKSLKLTSRFPNLPALAAAQR